jgi:tetratricopeptide (TPR) repeat protein
MKQQTLVLAFAIALVSSGDAFAQNNMLRGKVRASNGVTVNNAIVELRIGGGAMISQTVTRNEGDFTFSNLSGGEYEVSVSIAGYEPAIQMARFNQNDRSGFSEVINIEVLIRPKRQLVPAPPGTSYAQEVPKPARAAYERAVARLREGKSDEAVVALREAIAAFNDYFDAHYALGRELFRAGKDNEALEALERARQINDRQDAVYYIFGLVMMKQGKYAVAEFAFREATRLNAINVWSRFHHGQALIELAVRSNDERQRKEDLSAAEKELDRAWENSEKRLPEVYLQRARIHEIRGQKEAAAAALEDYLKAVPEAKNGARIRAAIAKLRGENK